MNLSLLAMLSAALASAFVLSPSLVYAQASNTETEEAQNLIEHAESKFIVCKPIETIGFSEVQFYNEQECDHDILFLKGICEASDNTAYDWCFNTDMERYLNDRGITNSPRPPDTWCNMFIDKCILKYEAMKESTAEISEEYDLTTGQDLIDSLDESIEELQQKRQGQGSEEQIAENEDAEDEEGEDN